MSTISKKYELGIFREILEFLEKEDGNMTGLTQL
jgi:hypothetical protein